MPAMLAIGLGTVAIIAAVLLFVTGYTTAAVIAAVVGVAFDLLFVRALAAARREGRS